MIRQTLESIARRQPRTPVLIESDCVFTSGKLLQRADAISEKLPTARGERIDIATTSAANLVTALSAVDVVGGVPVILGPSTSSQDVERLKHSAIISDAATADAASLQVETLSLIAPSPGDSNTLILFTSGTSGPPKPVVHNWQTLTAAVKQSPALRRRRWLLAYQPNTFAGLQVIFQALLTDGTLVSCASSAAAPALSPEEIARSVLVHRVEMASATPTFWRWLLNGVSPQSMGQLPLRQITLGGEIADQVLLERLAEAFPGTRITHIYASTEMGVCFSVHDGRAGFPASWMEDETLSCRMRVDDAGELLVRSPRRMQRYAEDASDMDGWFSTGDFVEVTGDRVMFTPRKSDTIHVGGQKVKPNRVEAIIRDIPGVMEVRVFGIDSSLAGQLVRAEIQLAEGHDELAMRRQIQTACLQQLPKHMTPALVSFTSQITRPGEKMTRRA